MAYYSIIMQKCTVTIISYLGLTVKLIGKLCILHEFEFKGLGCYKVNSSCRRLMKGLYYNFFTFCITSSCFFFLSVMLIPVKDDLHCVMCVLVAYGNKCTCTFHSDSENRPVLNWSQSSPVEQWSEEQHPP